MPRERVGTALVTGASSGIGRELARIHAARGGDLVVVARRAERLAALKAELEAAHGVAVHTLPLDLAAPGAADEAARFADGYGLAIDVLVNNAGFGGGALALVGGSRWSLRRRIDFGVTSTSSSSWM
jgi:short-subunit dehydrogenase